MTFHNSALARLVPDGNYLADDLARVEAALNAHQTLTFVRLPSGLYSASSAGEAIVATGYANVWVRDNIYVAFAHHPTGARHIATEVVGVLIGFFTRYCHRFHDIISGAVDPQDVAIVRTYASTAARSARSETSAGRTRRTTRSDTSCGCRQRWPRARAEAGRERRLDAHTSRALLRRHPF